MGGDKRCFLEYLVKNFGGFSWQWYCFLQVVGGIVFFRLRVLLSFFNTLKVVLNVVFLNFLQVEGSIVFNRLKMVLFYYFQVEGGIEYF